MGRITDPIDATPPPAGHNNPPTAFDEFKAKVMALLQNADRWVTKRPKLDKATAELCQAALAQLTATRKLVDGARRAAKIPHEEAAKAVDSQWNPLLLELDAAATALKPLLETWLRSERDRLQAERDAADAAARKLKAEADEKARLAQQTGRASDIVAATIAADQAITAQESVAAVPERAAVKGALASRATSLRTTWQVEVVDPDAALQHYRNSPAVIEAVAKSAAGDVRAGMRTIPGCRVFAVESL